MSQPSETLQRLRGFPRVKHANETLPSRHGLNTEELVKSESEQANKIWIYVKI